MVHKEVAGLYLALVILLFAYILTAFAPPSMLLYVSLFSIILGAALMFTGAWGSDYAFSTALGELNQSKRRGRIRGRKGEVYVPFLGNYTATEWWNINWILIAIGAALLTLGTFTLGISI